MKKFLSLVLALVMTMSLVTVSAGAKDFDDNDAITYAEAIDVMSAAGIIDGYTDGSFRPTTALNRGAAAKIICNMILGPTTAAALRADTATFKDVPTNHTFAGYIAFCAEQGIITGYADGTFRPAAPLSGYAFMKMLLGALGYDQDVEGYVGPNWSVQVAKRALNLGLDDGLVDTFNGVATVTREEACLYAFNTLTTTMVEYDAKTTVSVGGSEVVIAGSGAKEVKQGAYDSYYNGGKADKTLEFCEKYFSKLSWELAEDATYGRPSHTWLNGKKEIGTYADTPDYVYTEAVTNEELCDELGKAVVNDKDIEWTAYLNGEAVKGVKAPVKANDDPYGKTANGVITEVYVYDNEVVIVYIEQYLAEVSKVKTNSDDEEVITVKNTQANLKDKTFVVDGYEAGDLVVITVDDKEIASVYDPEVVSGEITAVEQKTKKQDAYFEVDDTKYVYNAAWTHDDPELRADYDVYLDNNGFVIGFAEIEGEIEYLYVKDAHKYMSKFEAEVVFADATADTILATGDDLNNIADLKGKVFAYSVNSKGVYTLEDGKTPVGPKVIENGSAWLGKQLTDKATVFVDVMDEVAYTGYENVPSYENAYYVAIDEDGDKVIDLVFITAGDLKDSTDGTWFYVADASDYKTKKDDDGVKYTVRTVYVDGEETTMLFEAGNGGADSKIKNNGEGLYVANSINSKDYVTKVTAKDVTTYESVLVGEGTFENGQKTTLDEETTIKKNYWAWNDDTQFIVVDGDDVYVGGAENMIEAKLTGDLDDERTYVTVISSDKNLAEVVYVVVVDLATMRVDYFNAAIDAVVNGDEDVVGTVGSGAKYTFVGEFTATAKGIDYKGEQANNDFARMLRGLYKTGKADVIKYKGVTYKWNDAEPLRGSNFFNGETSLVAAFQDDLNAGSVVLNIDGLKVTFKFEA